MFELVGSSAVIIIIIIIEMGLFVRTTGSLLVQLFRVPYRYPTAS
jgi:hypothetical protein